MNRIVKYIHRSLSTRLTLLVVTFVAIIFIVTYGQIFNQTRQMVRDSAWNKATATLDGTVLHIDNTLHAVEVAANNMLNVIEKNLDKPDNMFDYSRQVLVNNPELAGCSISFDPFYYKSKGRYFSAYSYNNGDSIQTEQEGTDNYQYHCMDWYLIPKLLDRPYWIEPFMEDAQEGIIVKDIFTSFSQPIHDKNGKSVGTFSVDICLDWFAQTVSAAKPYPNSYSILIGKGGTYLVHPDSTRLFYETIFTKTIDQPDSALTDLGKKMLAGESGNKTMLIDGELCYVFYKPFKNTGWSVAIICPESDIMAFYYRLRSALQWIAVVGLIILLVFCWYITWNRLYPLRHLARSAQLLARGQFTGIVPDTNRPDEIGQLQRGFKTMQQSLNKNIQEVRNQTVMLESRNKELLEAYEHVKEEERVKTAILHNMPDKMSASVADISMTAQKLCDEHKQLKDEEISEQVGKIEAKALQVTEMLDELLKTAQEETHSHHVERTDVTP